MSNYQNLYKKLSYQFHDETLITQALTHSSMSDKHYERLEFLGDSLLNLIIAEKLYQSFPNLREGELSRLRAGLVNGETLAELARELHIGDFLRLGIGEKKSGGADRDSILADCMEAIIGAIYLDADFEQCRERVITWCEERIAAVPEMILKKDPKTSLQEYVQAHHLPLPNYKIIDIKGKSHAQQFVIECRVAGIPYVCKGNGSTRRRAEQGAAAKLLEIIGV